MLLGIALAASAALNGFQLYRGRKQLKRQIGEANQKIEWLKQQKVLLEQDLDRTKSSLNILEHDKNELVKQLQACKIFAFSLKKKLKNQIAEKEHNIVGERITLNNINNSIAETDQTITLESNQLYQLKQAESELMNAS